MPDRIRCMTQGNVSQTVCCGLFKTLNIYTSFQPELSKCCHEVTVGNVGDCVMLPEKVMNSPKKTHHLSRCHM